MTDERFDRRTILRASSGALTLPVLGGIAGAKPGRGRNRGPPDGDQRGPPDGDGTRGRGNCDGPPDGTTLLAKYEFEGDGVHYENGLGDVVEFTELYEKDGEHGEYVGFTWESTSPVWVQGIDVKAGRDCTGVDASVDGTGFCGTIRVDEDGPAISNAHFYAGLCYQVDLIYPAYPDGGEYDDPLEPLECYEDGFEFDDGPYGQQGRLVDSCGGSSYGPECNEDDTEYITQSDGRVHGEGLSGGQTDSNDPVEQTMLVTYVASCAPGFDCELAPFQRVYDVDFGGPGDSLTARVPTIDDLWMLAEQSLPAGDVPCLLEEQVDEEHDH